MLNGEFNPVRNPADLVKICPFDNENETFIAYLDKVFEGEMGTVAMATRYAAVDGKLVGLSSFWSLDDCKIGLLF